MRNGDYPYPENGGNTYLYTATAPKTQEWLIIGVGINEFKIVLRNDMTLVLTAYPSSANGTSSGKSSTSPGNIFLAAYSDSNAYQRWKFIDENGSSTALNGTYYINNTETGKYLHKNQALSTPDAASGLISNLGNTIRWKITHLGNKEYTIRPAKVRIKIQNSSYLILQKLSERAFVLQKKTEYDIINVERIGGILI